MDMNLILAIAGVVFGVGGIWTVVQFFIQRYDDKKGIQVQINKIMEDRELDRAILARTHILRFNDEL